MSFLNLFSITLWFSGLLAIDETSQINYVIRNDHPYQFSKLEDERRSMSKRQVTKLQSNSPTEFENVEYNRTHDKLFSESNHHTLIMPELTDGNIQKQGQLDFHAPLNWDEIESLPFYFSTDWKDPNRNFQALKPKYINFNDNGYRISRTMLEAKNWKEYLSSLTDTLTIEDPNDTQEIQSTHLRKVIRITIITLWGDIRGTINLSKPQFPNSIDPYFNPDSVPEPPFASPSLIDEIQYYVKYAGAAYCKVNSWKNRSCNYCKEFDSDVIPFSIANPTTKIEAIIVVLPRRSEIVLAYRGSDSISKLIASISDEVIDYPSVPEARVHKFFYESVNSIQGDVVRKLAPLLSQNPDYRLVIVGHSLGGSLANLAAPLIHRDIGLPYSQMRTITYGQLRVGNLHFAQWYNQLEINYTRVVNGMDEATNTPNLSEDWVHVRSEVHITGGRYYDCTTTKLENPHCSLGRTAYLGILTDHERVDDKVLTPDHCDGWSHFLKPDFFYR